MLVPLDESFTSFEGYVKALGDEFYLRLEPEGIEGDEDLETLLSGRLKELHSLRQSLTLHEFEDEVAAALAAALRKAKWRRQAASPRFYTGVAQDLAQVGWEKVEGISEGLRSIYLALSDAQNRRFRFDVQLPSTYPEGEPEIEADLPQRVRCREGARLPEIANACYSEIRRWQDAFQLLEDVDKRLQVLEPHDGSRCHLHRRISLSETGGALHFRLNETDPRSLPSELRFLGAEDLVAPLRERLACNARAWARESPLPENLEAVLAVQLPQRKADTPQGDESDASEATCGVCYSSKDPMTSEGEGSLPETPCQNPACGRIFHASCLRDWFHAGGARRAYDTLLGSCPYCDTRLSLPLST